VGDSKTDHNLLGFAVLLKYFQYEGRFPSQKQDIPAALTLHLAQQADFSSQFSSEKMIESRKEKSQEKEREVDEYKQLVVAPGVGTADLWHGAPGRPATTQASDGDGVRHGP